VLYTSGYAENAIAHHGVLRDGVDLIQKPYALATLTKRVREVLDRE
jgi:two-component system, cell cycle sensor histidine kinase and response regulator CckA